MISATILTLENYYSKEFHDRGNLEQKTPVALFSTHERSSSLEKDIIAVLLSNSDWRILVESAPLKLIVLIATINLTE